MAAGYVYFIEAIGLKKFKIGKAEVLPTRFGQLDTASLCELRIYGVIKSEKYHKIENQLHKKYDSRRIKRENRRPKEWFRLSQREVEKIVFSYGGFCLADGDYATDISLYRKMMRWIDERCPRAMEKACQLAAGALTLFFLASTQPPDVVPEAIFEIPAYRGLEPKIELIEDYHRWIFSRFLEKESAFALGVTENNFTGEWDLFFGSKKSWVDSAYSDNKNYQEWKKETLSWSLTDSLEYILRQYVFEMVFISVYEDSQEYSQVKKEFSHYANSDKCPFKNSKPVILDGKNLTSHEICTEELTNGTAIYEKSIAILKRIRNKYPDMAM